MAYRRRSSFRKGRHAGFRASRRRRGRTRRMPRYGTSSRGGGRM